MENLNEVNDDVERKVGFFLGEEEEGLKQVDAMGGGLEGSTTDKINDDTSLDDCKPPPYL